MFRSFKKDPLNKLQGQSARRLEQARDLQRSGDVKGYAELSAQSDKLLQQLERLEVQRGDQVT